MPNWRWLIHQGRRDCTEAGWHFACCRADILHIKVWSRALRHPTRFPRRTLLKFLGFYGCYLQLRNCAITKTPPVMTTAAKRSGAAGRCHIRRSRPTLNPPARTSP